MGGPLIANGKEFFPGQSQFKDGWTRTVLRDGLCPDGMLRLKWSKWVESDAKKRETEWCPECRMGNLKCKHAPVHRRRLATKDVPLYFNGKAYYLGDTIYKGGYVKTVVQDGSGGLKMSSKWVPSKTKEAEAEWCPECRMGNLKCKHAPVHRRRLATKDVPLYFN